MTGVFFVYYFRLEIVNNFFSSPIRPRFFVHPTLSWAAMKGKSKPTFFSTSEGRFVRAHTAHYVAARMHKTGVTLPQFEASGFNLSALGISKLNALKELYPLIPKAHFWYCDWYAHWYGNRGIGNKAYLIWGDFWTAVLHNRITYFFRKHSTDGHLLPCIAGWRGAGGTVSEDELWLVPPPIPTLKGVWPEGNNPPESPPDERPLDPGEVHSLRMATIRALRFRGFA
jgi:hypothetical protein